MSARNWRRHSPELRFTAGAMGADTLKQPTAWLPLLMSGAALSLIIWHIAFVGTAPQADEGTEAHLWQVLMAGQLPVIAFFAITWLPRRPPQALAVLALQALAGFAATLPIYLLRW